MNLKMLLPTAEIDKDPCPECSLFTQDEGCSRLDGTCFGKIWQSAQDSIIRHIGEIDTDDLALHIDIKLSQKNKGESSQDIIRKAIVHYIKSYSEYLQEIAK